MTPQSPLSRPVPSAPLVLVADDDPRVLELLQIALTQQNFRVVTASDGEEAIRRALAERPDIAVLDVRMPRRTGLEVCDCLRHDPDDPDVPVILVSASADTESRLEALARGADDVLAKPFSPRELIARMRRLLGRSTAVQLHRQRAESLERELSHAKDEVRRAQAEMEQQQRMRAMGARLEAEFHGTLDPDELAGRILTAAQRHVGAVALLGPASPPGGVAALVPVCVRADGARRFEQISIAPEGDLAALLKGLARPLRRHELDRMVEVRDEVAPMVTAGASVLVPLRASEGLVGVLVAADRSDGRAPDARDMEALAAIGDAGALALENAWRFRAAQDHVLALLAGRVPDGPRAATARTESLALAGAAAAAIRLPMRERSLLSHAVALGAWGWGEECRAALAGIEPSDPTGRIRALRALIDSGETLDAPAGSGLALLRAARIAGVCVRHATARTAGRSPRESFETALSWAGSDLDASLVEALEHAYAAAIAADRSHHAPQAA